MSSPILNALHQVCQANDEGVRYLQAGNTFDACNTLAKASSMLAHLPQQEQCEAQPLQAGQKRRPEDFYHWVELSSNAYFDCIHGDYYKETTPPSLFLRAVVTRRTARTTNRTSTSTAGEDISPVDLCWIVLYNLALSCHIYGYKLGANGRQHVHKAHELYDIVRTQYLPQVFSSASSSSSELQNHAAMLSLALHYNMGYIYQDFEMHEESQACLKRAKEVIVLFNNGATSSSTPPDDFTRNVSLILMVSKRPSRAPAA